jgi:hypothetical protein
LESTPFEVTLELQKKISFRLVAGALSYFLRLVRLLNPQHGHPLKALYASDAVRSENHRACLSRPLFFAGGENASTRYYIKENIVRLMVWRYFMAVIQTYDHYIEVFASKNIDLGFLTRHEVHESVYVIFLLFIDLYHVIFSLALSAGASS